MIEHAVKCWPEFFQPLIEGRKPFELRFNDRNYRTGDVLILQEWDKATEAYTGREARRRITYTYHGAGLEYGFVVLGLAPIAEEVPHGVPAVTINEHAHGDDSHGI